jgi:GTP 3',8-cyclase
VKYADAHADESISNLQRGGSAARHLYSTTKAHQRMQTPTSVWSKLPLHLLYPASLLSSQNCSRFSTSSISSREQSPRSSTGEILTHLTPSGSVHMVDISSKAPSTRLAIATSTVVFSNPTAAKLIAANTIKKGDVLSVARIAGIMAAKRCADLIPLCHPIALTKVGVDVDLIPPSRESPGNEFGIVSIQTKVQCNGKTGVEMEALTAASVAALTVYDMCKAVDKGMRIEGTRVSLKKGGKSGEWREEGFAENE